MSEFGNLTPNVEFNQICEDEDDVENNQLISGDWVGLNNETTEEATEIITPEVGMKFSTYDEAFEFYRQYAMKVGFPVRKRNSKKGVDGNLTNATFACSREGRKAGTSNSMKPHPTMQTGCKAKMTMCSDVSGTFHITRVCLQHNHRTSPTKSRLYRCNRQLNDQVKRKLEVNDIAGIPMHKSFNSAIVDAGGYEQLTFTEKDCRNYIDKVRRLRLGEGDAIAIQSYFLKMQKNSPGFFFSLDVDDDFRLKNVFWADNRCRLAYKEFGDVVTFDTTYLKNRYDMPFAPFVGVNHQGHSTLLGCGLICSETTETFVWLFKTWLECMDGVAPNGIITDQDRAMQNAIEIVFPNTKQRWCLWHIMKKLPEKFGYHAQKISVMYTVHNVVYDSQIPDEFENGWGSMLDKYDLHEHNWLTGLYQERRHWVPCFLRTSFWAGMSTTQRSESINAFFDGYVHSKTSLKQFVEQYERALRSKVEKEFHADFKSYAQMVPCSTAFSLEKQFQNVYTIAKFKEFQAELMGKVYCDLMSIEDGYGGVRYIIREDIIQDDFQKRKNFTVIYERVKCQIVCSCHLFEFRGIICRHCLMVLIRENVKLLPDIYILRRWRRDVVRAYTRVKSNYDGSVSTPAQLRYDKVCTAFEKMANLLADDEDRIQELLEWIEIRTNGIITGQESFRWPSDRGNVDQQSTKLLLDPQLRKTKGAPRKLRRKGPLETKKKKSKGQTKSNIGETSTQVLDSNITSFGPGGQSQPCGGESNWIMPAFGSQAVMPAYAPQSPLDGLGDR